MDNEFKKLLQGGLWADDAPDNATPESTSITPVLSRRLGWPASYSQAGGNVPDRRRINQQFRELTGAAFEVRMGVSQYDSDIDYPINAISAVSGQLYRALIANGPSTNNTTNPTSPNNTAWEPLGGATGVPDMPHSIHYQELDLNQFRVRCTDGRDNGARILDYRWQYKTSNDGDWTPATDGGASTTFAEWDVSGVAVGTRVFVRVRSRNQVGQSDWKEDATGYVLRGTVPSGGGDLSLRATATGANTVRLNWSEPLTGGTPILRYIVQWRDGTQSFSASRETSVSNALTTDISSLTENTEYFFWVSAVNAVGQGPWSTIVSAIPRRAAQTIFHPTLRAPSLNANVGGTIRATTSLVNSTMGTTADVTKTVWQLKRADALSFPSGTTYTSGTGLTTHTFSGLEGGITYDVRYQVFTSANNTNPPFSPIGQVVAVGAVPGAPSNVGGSAWWRRTSPTGGHEAGGMTWSITDGPDNGSPIINYQVAVTFPSRAGPSFDPTSQGTTPIRLNFTTTSRRGTFRNINIAKGGQGTISARAMNANGWGPWKVGQTITVGGD